MRRFIVFFIALCLVHPAWAADEPFASWLAKFHDDALAHGITAATFDRAMSGVQPIPHIIELDNAQPENVLTFAQYLGRIATPARRAAVERHYRKNRRLLDVIGKRYGVAPRYIVALWGIETDFGRNIGTYPVFDSLTTLAYDGRRSAFFRQELINALTIVQVDHVDPQTMVGSWAGAMGQSQFMPSSFLRYAVSYDRAGPPDIWRRRSDVFASIANYLARSGWHKGEGWGVRVSLPPYLDSSQIGQKRSFADWARQGLRRPGGKLLPESRLRATLVRPGGADGPSFLVTDNFGVLLHWNNSSYFAIAVGYLADSVK